MNEAKFSLADLLTVLGAACFGFFCFLSFNFLSLGETVPSILRAVVAALILGGLAFVLKLLKKTSGNFKRCIIWEWVSLFLFAGLAFVAVFPFSHYFAVVDQKAEIQRKVAVNIDSAKRMFTRYEDYAKNRENIYRSRLNSVVSAKVVNPGEYHNYGFVDGTNDNTQVENKTFTLHAKLFPSNYQGADGMKQVATTWMANAENTLENKWAFTFRIVDVVNNVQPKITEWEKELEKLSSFRAQGEATDNFTYPMAFNDTTDKLTELGSPTASSTIYAIGLYALMLLSYFVSKRHTRYPGLKVIFGTSGAKENEL